MYLWKLSQSGGYLEFMLFHCMCPSFSIQIWLHTGWCFFFAQAWWAGKDEGIRIIIIFHICLHSVNPFPPLKMSYYVNNIKTNINTCTLTSPSIPVISGNVWMLNDFSHEDFILLNINAWKNIVCSCPLTIRCGWHIYTNGYNDRWGSESWGLMVFRL